MGNALVAEVEKVAGRLLASPLVVDGDGLEA
jgi:hypothetical protein